MVHYLRMYLPIKHGGRKIAMLNKEQFDFFVKKYLHGWEKDLIHNQTLYDSLLFYILEKTENRNSQVYKDFKGLIGEQVNFGFEHYNIELRFADNYYPYLFVTDCHNESEIPFCFMIYYNGKTFRVYLPKRGNTWRTFKDDNGNIKKCLLNNGFHDDETDDPDWKYVWDHCDISETMTEEEMLNGGWFNHVGLDEDSCIEEFELKVKHNL